MRESALHHQRIVFYCESQAGKDPLTLALSPFQGGEGEGEGGMKMKIGFPDEN
jgi:hypothetical protein